MDANTKPATGKPWGRPFWTIFSLLVWTILGLGIFVPVLGHTGPTREGECHFAQRGLEQLTHCVNAWEKDHAQTAGQTMSDLWTRYREGSEPSEAPRPFAEAIEKEQNIDWRFCLYRAPSPPRREGPRGEARITAPFRYSRGPGDPIFELRSWDRKPMEDYMAFAKRKATMKIVVAILPWALLYAAGVGVIVMVGRARKKSGDHPDGQPNP